MKRVLIITPNWPPIPYPDMHRVRMSLPFFKEFGWEPLILKINPDEQEGIKDSELNRTVPTNIKTWQAGCIPKFWTHWFGLNNVGLRSFFHLAQLGNQIIQTQQPNLIFFSTTMFPLMVLGRYWYSKYRLPYVLDFQDPWLSDYQKHSKSFYQSIKYEVSQAIASVLEPFTLRQSTHVISVSSRYVDTLLKRYTWLEPEQFTVLPFGAAETDFATLEQSSIKHSHFNPADDKKHWVYVGRGGSDMAFALRCLFQALKRARQQEPQKFSDLILHFIGTDYAPGSRARKTVEPIAIECGIGDMVREHPHRIPYFEALQCLRDADALIVPGSDDPGYTASKIYPYILAQKPLLAIFHEMSSVASVLRATKAGTVVTFKTGEEISQVSEAISVHWLRNLPPAIPTTDWEAFVSYTAHQMTHRQCTIFDQCLNLTNGV